MSEILPSNCKINVIVKLYLTHALVCFKFFLGILNNIVKNTIQTTLDIEKILEVFYLNTIEQLFLFVEKLDQLEVCLPHGRTKYLLSSSMVYLIVEYQYYCWYPKL